MLVAQQAGVWSSLPNEQNSFGYEPCKTDRSCLKPGWIQVLTLVRLKDPVSLKVSYCRSLTLVNVHFCISSRVIAGTGKNYYETTHNAGDSPTFDW